MTASKQCGFEKIIRTFALITRLSYGEKNRNVKTRAVLSRCTLPNRNPRGTIVVSEEGEVLQKYSYKAYDSLGKFVKGTIVASDDKNFRDLLREQGMRCFEYRVVNKAKQVKSKPLKIGELIAFSRQLSSMLSSGLDLSLSLKMLYERTEKNKKNLKVVEARLFEEIQKGESLASAMQNLDNTFPSLYVSMVKSGELNGKIDESLLTLADYFEKEHKQRNQIKSAMSYPIILLVICALVVVLMSVVVLPRMADMIPEGTAMPLPTQILLGLKDFVVNQWFVVLIIIFALVVCIPIIKRIPAVAVFTGKFATRIPVIGKLRKMLYTATFARSLSTLYATGIPLLDAISMSGEILNNRFIEMQVREAVISIRKGSSIAEAFSIVTSFDAMLMTMIFVGEQSGTLDDILIQTARYFEEEAQGALKRLISLISPVMLMIMAVVIGFVLIAVMMPMLTLYQSIG